MKNRRARKGVLDPHNQKLHWDPHLWDAHMENIRLALYTETE